MKVIKVDESALIVSNGVLKMATVWKKHTEESLSNDERRTTASSSHYGWDFWNGVEEISVSDLPESIRQKWADKVHASQQQVEQERAHTNAVRTLGQMAESVVFPEIEGVIYFRANACTDSRVDFVAKRRGVSSLDTHGALTPSADAANLNDWLQETAARFVKGVISRRENNAAGGWLAI